MDIMVNYAAKLGSLTTVNSGQIDASEKNIGTVAWTYQAELGHTGGQGTGGGNIHNGWRQMSGGTLISTSTQGNMAVMIVILGHTVCLKLGFSLSSFLLMKNTERDCCRGGWPNRVEVSRGCL